MRRSYITTNKTNKSNSFYNHSMESMHRSFNAKRVHPQNPQIFDIFSNNNGEKSGYDSDFSNYSPDSSSSIKNKFSTNFISSRNATTYPNRNKSNSAKSYNSPNQQVYDMRADKRQRKDGNESDFSNYEPEKSPAKKRNFSKRVNFTRGRVKRNIQNNRIGYEDSDDSDIECIGVVVDESDLSEEDDISSNKNHILSSRASTSSDGKPLWMLNHQKHDVIMGMMKKMGYEPGKGLGAKKQGIIQPIEPRVRPGRGAIGAYGSERLSPIRAEYSVEIGQECETEKKEKISINKEKKSYSKDTVNASKHIEIISIESEDECSSKKIENIETKVINITDGKQIVQSGHDSITTESRVVTKIEIENLGFDVPEMKKNIQNSMKIIENRMKEKDRELCILEDQVNELQNKKQCLKNSLDLDSRDLKRLFNVQKILDEFFKIIRENPPIESCYEVFLKVHQEYFEEYRLFNLEDLAVVSLSVPIGIFFAQWDPLNDPTYGLDMMKNWKTILNGNESSSDYSPDDSDDMKASDKILLDSWIPIVRRSSQSWNPRENPYGMLKILDSWEQILSNRMKNNLLDQVILPRIIKEVGEWNPICDTIPIHSWLSPWISYLGDLILLPLLAPIHKKLTNTFNDWNPTKQNVCSTLKFCTNILTPSAKSAFIVQVVIPKLEKIILEMNFIPNRNEQYVEFHAVMDWTDVLGGEVIANILFRGFFPKWFETLKIWLDSPYVIQHEVMAWYNDWKGRIPYEIAEIGLIKDQLLRGLTMINHFKHENQSLKRTPPSFIPEVPIRFFNPHPPSRPPATQCSSWRR